ncbi:HAD-IB family phosphatase [Alkalicella caledoniensis]|uniref:phosphoserine phosphatase n=1 Tax=Alkalicella caledoniensis TaxID=2731377 RepID=A0A7G9W6N7_ALKCA|nr:HAD family phosphatase [Alkalicella caledoniensis]QNO14349.1 HAD-IB family phosphatase [Alkalicella caledoniensis]
MDKVKVVCFDMDGTLITNTNSVEYLCLLSGKIDEVRDVENREDQGEISWIEADYIKSKLFTALEVKRVEQEFERYIKLINNIEKVINELKSSGIFVILVTAGPVQVAEVIQKMFKFDKIYGSVYEVENGRFTGRILKHLGDRGKLNSLKSFCKEHDISLEKVVSVGDSASDIKIFKESGKSIAINYSSKLLGIADVYIRTNDLVDIMKHILG